MFLFLLLLFLLLLIVIYYPRKENYISYEVDPISFPFTKDQCVKYDPLPPPFPGKCPVVKDGPIHTPYYHEEPAHVKARNKRCYHLSFEDCMVTPTCGWKGQQKLDGEWKGHCYPGTTDGPLDPLKSPNYEEGEVWIPSEPNPWVAM